MSNSAPQAAAAANTSKRASGDVRDGVGANQVIFFGGVPLMTTLCS